jgi:hypothetical protein
MNPAEVAGVVDVQTARRGRCKRNDTAVAGVESFSAGVAVKRRPWLADSDANRAKVVNPCSVLSRVTSSGRVSHLAKHDGAAWMVAQAGLDGRAVIRYPIALCAFQNA